LGHDLFHTVLQVKGGESGRPACHVVDSTAPESDVGAKGIRVTNDEVDILI
jgi:hypothetical protein